MAIVKMRKLNLIAMSYDKDAILNALHRTGAAEIKLHKQAENTVVPENDGEETRQYLASVENALSVLTSAVESVQKKNNEKSDALLDGFDVSYSEFMSAKDYKTEADEIVATINALADEKNRLKGELSSILRKMEIAAIYSAVEKPLSFYQNTAHTRSRLGVFPITARDGLTSELEGIELCAYEVLATNGDEVLLHVATHAEASAETDGVLSTYGFTDCPYNGDKSGKLIFEEMQAQETDILQTLEQNEHTTYALKDKVRLLKVYCDYLAFRVEKADVSEKIRVTERTFLLEAYVPQPAEELVGAELREAAGSVFMEFSDPTEEETPPTLLQNNAIVSNFEGITNTYSAPNYREFDPNAVMAFFYSLFMGFIIADAGYGLLMFLVGGYLWWKNRAKPTGMSRLAGAFSVGGIFAIIWGGLFDSFFGFPIFPGDPIIPSAQTHMSHILGISIPTVLIIAMLVGITQLFAGYICKAVQAWRRGQVLDGVFDGLTWAAFSIGIILLIVGFVEEWNMPILVMVGGITAGASLLIAMLTAGRKEKFLGKFTKGFGAAYGVINYVSDILSYARLYGLMLAGAVVTGLIVQFTQYAFATGGVLLIALAIFLLVVGNLFNLVISLLGAYIHDARLQYVEFYGRFYEGDGELFKPLGGTRKYVNLLPQTSSVKKE